MSGKLWLLVEEGEHFLATTVLKKIVNFSTAGLLVAVLKFSLA
jgi:hypothetical protein